MSRWEREHVYIYTYWRERGHNYDNEIAINTNNK